jgi:hypothetical protein
MEETAVETAEGVKIVARTDAWAGNPEVKEHVTPVRVSIENNSGKPLRIRYREFALVGPDGERNAALPLYAIEGDVDRPVLTYDLDPLTEPEFLYYDYYVAPAYQSVYPGITPYAGPFAYDIPYYERYYRYWAEVPLPTAEMRRTVLPEGVVNDGGKVEGFLFFEKVDPEERSFTMHADLVNADSGTTFGDVKIRFINEQVARR